MTISQSASPPTIPMRFMFSSFVEKTSESGREFINSDEPEGHSGRLLSTVGNMR
jgi:hypothetical protein